MELTGWKQVSVIAFIVLCGVLGLAAGIYILVKLIAWIAALLHMSD